MNIFERIQAEAVTGNRYDIGPHLAPRNNLPVAGIAPDRIAVKKTRVIPKEHSPLWRVDRPLLTTPGAIQRLPSELREKILRGGC